jgi:hypothetical protein
LEALLACYLGQWPAAHGSGIRFPDSKLQDFYMRAYHLNEKLQAALENGAGESGFWGKVTGAAVSIAQSGRFDESDQILAWLQNSGERQWASILETAGDAEQNPEVQIWLLRRAREGHLVYDEQDEAERLRDKIDALETAAERASRPPDPPAPPEETEEDDSPKPPPAEVIAELENLTSLNKFDECHSLLVDRYYGLRPALATYFEARADQLIHQGEFDKAIGAFFVAMRSSEGSNSFRVRESAREARQAEWDRKRLNPVPDEPLVTPSSWDAGIGRVEWLAFRGRTEDADDLLQELRNALGEPDVVMIKTENGLEQVERYFDQIARYLHDDHPNTAEWFQDRGHFGVFAEARKRSENRKHNIEKLIGDFSKGLAKARPRHLAALLPGVSP